MKPECLSIKEKNILLLVYLLLNEKKNELPLSVLIS